MERVLTINRLEKFSVTVVETARENLVSGQANTNVRSLRSYPALPVRLVAKCAK